MRVLFMTLPLLLIACSASPVQPAAPLTPRDELIRQGYRAALVDGQLFYCRTEAVTGTAFPERVCLSETQVSQRQQATRDTLDSRALHPNLQCHDQNCDK